MTYTYYTLYRPPMPGAIPRDGLMAVQAYDERKPIQAIGRSAWGIAIYCRQLTQDEIEEYELIQAP